jgi:carbonic anhydrase/acetyltransferase-like protein (isoleucine patch superfamily)
MGKSYMKHNKKQGGILGSIKVSLISFIVFSLGFFPIVVYGILVRYFIPFNELWHYFLLPLLIYIGIVITLFYQFLISGLFIHVFKYKYEPGVYKYVYRDKMAFKWLVVCTLYTPMRKLLEIFPMGGMKVRYYRLLGMKVGKNTLVGGTIMDPCLTEIGDNCTMGLYAVIYGHIHDFEKETLTLDRIKIGNNVVIGAGVFIMPGVVIEDDVKIATGAVVTKDQILKKGRVYAGIPAKEIKIKKK